MARKAAGIGCEKCGEYWEVIMRWDEKLPDHIGNDIDEHLKKCPGPTRIKAGGESKYWLKKLR